MPDSIHEKIYALFTNSANRSLAENMKNAGVKVLPFPPVEIEKISFNETLIQTLKNLADFDWLIFPDVLAVDSFLENLEENAIDFYEMDLLRVCAFGEAVCDRLRFAAVHTDVIAPKNNVENVFSTIAEYAGESDLSGLKFLFPKEIYAGNELAEKLKSAGAEVFILPVYEIKIKNNLEITRLKTLLKGGAADEFIFASPTDFISLEYYFKGEKLAEVLSEIKISAADAVMLQAAKEYDLRNVGLFHFDKIAKVERR